MTIRELRDRYDGDERVLRYIRSQISYGRLSSKKVITKIKVAGCERHKPKIQEKLLADFDMHEALQVCQSRLYNAIWSDNKKVRNSKDLIEETVNYLRNTIERIEEEEEEKGEAY